MPTVYGNLLNENEFFMFALWRQRKTTFVELETKQKSTHKSAYYFNTLNTGFMLDFSFQRKFELDVSMDGRKSCHFVRPKFYKSMTQSE